MAQLETVEIVNKNAKSGFTRINKADFDPKTMKVYKSKADEDAEKAAAEAEAKAKAEAEAKAKAEAEAKAKAAQQ